MPPFGDWAILLSISSVTYGLNSRRLFFVRGKSVDIYIETRGALLLDTLAEPHGSAVLGRVHGSSGSSVDLLCGSGAGGRRVEDLEQQEPGRARERQHI